MKNKHDVFSKLGKAAMALMLLAASPAFAQLAKANQTLSMIQTFLLSVSVIIFTCAIMWAGFKMAWQHAKWAEIANIVWGGILVGGATGIAGFLVN